MIRTAGKNASRRRLGVDHRPATRLHLRVWCVYLAAMLLCIVGCKTYHNLPETIGNNTNAIDAIMCEVDAGVPPAVITDVPAPPVTLRSPVALDEISYHDLTLQEAIEIALMNSEVLRDLGTTILRTPARDRHERGETARRNQPTIQHGGGAGGV